MRFLITGGAGYIGSTLVEHLFNHSPHSVTVFDNLMYRQTSLTQHIHRKNFHFEHGDVRDSDRLKKAVSKADVIIPLAAIVGAPACDRDPQLALDVNWVHVRDIMESRSADQIVCYPNTNSGYGLGQGESYCTEETPLDPISHYGKTKCAAEKCVLDGGGMSLRLATVFGLSPRMRLDLLVNDFTFRAIRDGFLVLFEKHFKRNYIHVRDVCNAFTFLVNNPHPGHAFNVGLSSANLSKLELAEKIKEYLPKLVILSDEFAQDKDKRNYIVSNEKLEKLGWEPSHTLDDGIQEMIKAYPILFQPQQLFSNL